MTEEIDKNDGVKAMFGRRGGELDRVFALPLENFQPMFGSRNTYVLQFSIIAFSMGALVHPGSFLHPPQGVDTSNFRTTPLVSSPDNPHGSKGVLNIAFMVYDVIMTYVMTLEPYPGPTPP